MNSRKVTKEMREEAFEFLRRRYPNAFRLADIKPFKVGISHDLMVEAQPKVIVKPTPKVVVKPKRALTLKKDEKDDNDDKDK